MLFLQRIQTPIPTHPPLRSNNLFRQKGRLQSTTLPVLAKKTRTMGRVCGLRVHAARLEEQKIELVTPAAPILLPEGDWSCIRGGITAPLGFQASRIAANLRSTAGKADLSLLYCPSGATVAGVFTQNLLCAAPVQYDQEVLQRKSSIHAVLTNAGQANAATGPEGKKDVERCVSALARELSVETDEILVMSTGVIGHRIKMPNLLSALPSLTSFLSCGELVDLGFAEAITTTDLAYKTTAVELEIEGKKVRIGGVCKGSGMINPNMATLLGLITCDAAVEASVWKQMLSQAVQLSFNRITVDGDTSTNDTVLALSGGAVDLPLISDLSSTAGSKLQAALVAVCQGLAKSIAWDGEGATCLLEVKVIGAECEEDLAVIAKSIANSSLTKAAIFGHDPNWGRIAAAAGYAGVKFSIEELDITLGDIQLMKNGVPLDFDAKKASSYLKEQCGDRSVVPILVKVGNGAGEGTVWGCDLSYDYVRINAEYTT